MSQTFSWQGIEGPWKFTQPLALSARLWCGLMLGIVVSGNYRFSDGFYIKSMILRLKNGDGHHSSSFHRDFSRDTIPGWMLIFPGFSHVSMYE